MFDSKLGLRSRLVTKGNHTLNAKIRGVAHVLWPILYVEYNGDGLVAI